MNTNMILRPAAAVLAVSLLSGCAAFRASTTDVDVTETRHMGADYDYSDMRKISESVANELATSDFLGKLTAAPIFMIAGVENRTSNYVDTKGLTDKIRTTLFKTGKAQFVNEARREDLLKEQGYQAANATPETQVAVGRQMGAKYMISGSLMEMKDQSARQVRVSKQKLNYYKLTVEVTDLEGGLMAWTTEKEFARQASLPIIGW
jgi:uncharacterized protein (TIGR02722 family)